MCLVNAVNLNFQSAELLLKQATSKQIIQLLNTSVCKLVVKDEPEGSKIQNEPACQSG
jgi:hypothetical protein